MTSIQIGPASPFFIVDDAVKAAKFYRDKLGFEILLLAPDIDPFFAMVRRGSAQILLKAVANSVAAVPNYTRHKWAPWDAFIHVTEPLVLAHEFTSQEIQLQSKVQVREDGLQGFEVQDEDGYILFFGTPV